MQAYCKTLPEGFREIAVISCPEFGFWQDLSVTAPGLLLAAGGWVAVKPSLDQLALALLVFVVCIYPYFGVHELLHGVVYKLASGQPVKIRFSLTGAACLLPEGYVSGSVACICTAAPLVILGIGLLLGSLTAAIRGNWLWLSCALLLVLHLLGCRSDIHLLKQLGKYRRDSIWVRDSGAQQRIYQKEK